MSCYQPYFGAVPYFSVLTYCGFEEHGGIVDCIKPINMPGINELLVSQAGSSMSRPERLHELEELLEFPLQVSAAELDSRFQDLCSLLQKARDTFNCRLEEEQENPFQELRVQLQKAKDRFHARIAEGNAKPSHHGCRTKASSRDVNPVQELRDAFRMARKHFVPLLDEYICTATKNIAVTEQGSARLCSHQAPIAVEISRTNAVDCSAILSAYAVDDRFIPRPPSARNRMRSGPESFIRPVRERMPCEASSYSGEQANSNHSKGSHLEALITKELQRREEGIKLHRNGRSSDGDRSMSPTIGRTSDADGHTEDSKDGYKGCVPGFLSRMKVLTTPAQDLMKDGNKVELSSAGHETPNDGVPTAAPEILMNPKAPRNSRLGKAPTYIFEPIAIDRGSFNIRGHEERVKDSTAPGKTTYET